MRIFSRIVLMLLIPLFCLTPPIFAAVETGAKAPDFTLPDTNGNERSLSEFLGKHVVLEWTNPDCPFVKKHYDSGNMQALQKKNTANNVVWLSIASSTSGKQGHYSANQWDELMNKNGSSATAVLLDPKGRVGKLYGAKTTPHMYVINSEGDLVYQGAIDSKSGWDSKEIATADNYVQAALDQSMAGEAVGVPSTKPYGCSVKY